MSEITHLTLLDQLAASRERDARERPSPSVRRVLYGDEEAA